ncbi:hypothetical protein SAMN05660766_2033 [Curtobacterium sp. 314Chir4.1]|uniref:hypothetical protein n=1 Tax=Curtobacterium sp. 314Chir4.1 TaxID=1279028 RepID=UPI000BCA6F90|nr:hypothetical protein [Curtobacterium sp. 314Chir4.1]SOC88330.1 hypothetical protein SAMN05660766_2033 [Curtobacterium sp. 314Chir4.1]
MSVLSWQRFTIGLRLILCGGPALVCVFSIAEFPKASGWWMLGIGAGVLLLTLVVPAVGILATRNSVWLLAVPFWVVRIRIVEIASVTIVDVRPLEDFGGWGIKGSSRRRGLLLAADGQRAVRIRRENGQVFLATSGNAERAASTIAVAAEIR